VAPHAINSAYPANRPVAGTRITRALVTLCVCIELQTAAMFRLHRKD